MTVPNEPDTLERAAHEVEAELEELGDPEGAPSLPAATLAAQATAGLLLEQAATPSSGREILRLSWPIMLAHLLISISGVVDRAMIGRLAGEGGAATPLAAVGFATQFFFLIQSTLFAVGLACVALMARAIGAGDAAGARRVLTASVQVAAVVTLVLITIMLIGARPILAVLGAEQTVVDAAIPYLNLIVGSSMILAISLVLDSALRANRDMRTPMWIATAVTVVKLAGNWVLIFGYLGAPRLELLGAGLATVISQVVGLALFLAVMHRQPHDSPVRFSWRTPGAAAVRREVVRIALPGIAERILMNLAMLSYFWVLSRYYGTVAVAAYTVGIALLSFSWIPGTAYGQTCATLVGQALGAGKPALATRTGWQSAGLATGTAVVLAALVILTRQSLAEIFTQDAQVIGELVPFMLALAIAQPFLQLHFTLGGAHRGAGDTWTPLVAAALGNWLFRVPLACFFAIQLEAPIVWVWYALIFDHVARAAFLVWSFRRGRWKTRLSAGVEPSRPGS